MRTIPVRQSLHRHNLIMGGERELILSIGLVSFVVGFGGMTWIAGITAVVTYVFGVLVARRMAKADPVMVRVWMRHIKQQIYYPAKTSIWRNF
ncbi:MAG: VirB3 family type IV secretion system protein [Desulfovibrionaceae bacterium]|nr:VirB3 family type IV secretion system protein [Desulfovibrionaceae bacterium]MBF0514199.1 VirB3 family type IV secretion system protein [Desulfovibrionaceae bacterium]